MRQLITGLVTGFLFGAALAASAGYYNHDRWTRVDPLQQLGYVGGVADAIEAINTMIQIIGTDSAADIINAADRCTDPLRLGQVRDIAIGASAKHPDLTPAHALLLELADCSIEPAQPQPQPQPYQAPSSTAWRAQGIAP